MVRRVLRSYGWKESYSGEFREYWITPYVLGGFGGGTSGRRSIEPVSVRSKVTFRTFVTGIGHRSKEWKVSAFLRAKGKLPMPGISVKLLSLRVKGDPKMEPLQAKSLRDQPKLKVDWTVWDLSQYKDAYRRKLNLEWKLQMGETILSSDLPRPLELKNVDRGYRNYRKLIGNAKGIDGTETAGETHHIVKAWIAEVWSGLCYRKLRFNTVVEWLPLARLAHEIMMRTSYKRGLLSVLV
jgi:hypothetical protein